MMFLVNFVAMIVMTLMAVWLTAGVISGNVTVKPKWAWFIAPLGAIAMWVSVYQLYVAISGT